MAAAAVAAEMSPIGDGHIGRIPVRNLWLLMLYASHLFQVRGCGQIGLEDSPDDLPDLVAEVLARAVEARVRRRLTSGYRPREAVLSRLRGRIDMLATEGHRLLERGRVACRFDELTVDTPRNRYVLAALERLAGMVRQDLSQRCCVLAHRMRLQGVSGGVPTRAEMSTDRFSRHDADDRLMIAAARLAFDLALLTESAGIHALWMPDRDERWVRRLFEKAVGGFYDVVLTPLGWQVRRGAWISWSIDKRTDGIDRLLPTMQTDVVLDHAPSGRKIVIDTKFTSIVTRGWHRDESLRSGYMYQMYAYLRSQAGRGDARADSATGLLLHPSVGEAFDEAVVVQGHEIRFSTIDLTGSPADFRAQLLRLCEPLLQ